MKLASRQVSPGAPWSTELAWLVEACVGGIGGTSPDRAPPDWRTVLALARRHRVIGLVAAHLEQAPAGLIPDALRQELVKARREQVMAFMAQVAETVRIVRVLEESGIASIVLKGAPLALELYPPQPELRHSVDIDLLVAPERFTEAQAILMREGYVRRTPAPGLTPAGDGMARHLLNAFEHVCDERDTKLELHHRLLLDPYTLDLPFDVLLANARTVTMAGTDVRVLGEPHASVYLCCHAAGHLFFRLKWLADLARLFDRLPAESISSAQGFAGGAGCSRHVTLSLVMLERLTGRSFELLTPADRRAVSHLVDRALAAILAPERSGARFTFADVPADVAELIYGLQLAGNGRSRAFALLQHLVNHDDIRALGLGVRWRLLYAMIGRPLALKRWLGRQWLERRSTRAG